MIVGLTESDWNAQTGVRVDVSILGLGASEIVRGIFSCVFANKTGWVADIRRWAEIFAVLVEVAEDAVCTGSAFLGRVGADIAVRVALDTCSQPCILKIPRNTRTHWIRDGRVLLQLQIDPWHASNTILLIRPIASQALPMAQILVIIPVRAIGSLHIACELIMCVQGDGRTVRTDRERCPVGLSPIRVAAG